VLAGVVFVCWVCFNHTWKTMLFTSVFKHHAFHPETLEMRLATQMKGVFWGDDVKHRIYLIRRIFCERFNCKNDKTMNTRQGQKRITPQCLGQIEPLYTELRVLTGLVTCLWSGETLWFFLGEWAARRLIGKWGQRVVSEAACSFKHKHCHDSWSFTGFMKPLFSIFFVR